MLYKQLNRVNELDREINNLHQRLTNLYTERSNLIAGKTDAPASLAADTSQPVPLSRSVTSYSRLTMRRQYLSRPASETV